MLEYEPFNLPEPTAEERQQKHFLDSYGLWLFVNYPFLNEKCLCGARHLDADSICLNSQCLCENFVQEGLIPGVEKRLPKNVKEEGPSFCK
jgi:hypothetical protein